MKSWFLVLIFVSLLLLGWQPGISQPIPAFAPLPFSAHAHNDYQHENPLWDALHYGFSSIEADVHLVDGEFLVAHDREDCSPERTLKSLYLDPLRQLVQRHGGSVYENGAGVILLVDVKSSAEISWKALLQLLWSYEDIISHGNSETRKTGLVRVVVSGKRDFRSMSRCKQPIADYDGRLADIEEHPNKSIITLISADWTEEFKWQGESTLQDEETSKLKNIVRLTHGQNRRVRFWGTDVPDSTKQQAIWRVLQEMEVDFISTDKLTDLHPHLKVNSRNRPKIKKTH